MAVTSTLKLPLEVSIPLTGLTTGTIKVRAAVGTAELDFAAGEITWAYQEEFTLAASGTKEIDLYDFGGGLTPDGQAITAATVKLFQVYLEIGSNSSGVTMAPSASNGWDALLGANGTVTLESTTAKGEAFVRQSPAGLAVTDATDHLLKFTNLDGTEPATVQLIAAGA